MSVELIRKYNISPSGLGHARPTFDPISTKKKFEIRSDYSNGGEEEGNLKIFGQRADPFRFNFSISRSIVSRLCTIRSDLHKNEEKDSNGTR